MKVIALNSSPRGEGISKTGIMLDALVEGMRQAGAEVETIHLRKKKINNCIGCYTCWTKTPGVCVHKDDMTRRVIPEVAGSRHCSLCDALVPLYRERFHEGFH